MLKHSIVIALCFLLTLPAFSRTRKVDDFKNGSDSVSVFFYDPLERLEEIDAGFNAKNDKDKSSILDEYLHKNPLYLFRLTNTKTKDVRYLCIRGNPQKTNTKFFYKVEVIENAPDNFNPSEGDYSNKIVRVVEGVNCGGTLFENMSVFDGEENKKFVGNGIMVFGYFRRVQPYAEIKSSIIDIIQSLE
jgi:hypothetical protein